jgi:hypothetical protein
MFIPFKTFTPNPTFIYGKFQQSILKSLAQSNTEAEYPNTKSRHWILSRARWIQVISLKLLFTSSDKSGQRSKLFFRNILINVAAMLNMSQYYHYAKKKLKTYWDKSGDGFTVPVHIHQILHCCHYHFWGQLKWPIVFIMRRLSFIPTKHSSFYIPVLH